MTTIAPPQEEIAEMSGEDLKILQDKIATYRKTPMYLRLIAPAVLALITWLVYEFLDPSEMYYLFVLGYVSLYLLTEWALYRFFKDIKAEIRAGRKHIWRGTLMERYHRKGRNSASDGPRGYVWNVSGREFVLSKEEYTAASPGEEVRVEHLPESDLVLRVQPLT